MPIYRIFLLILMLGTLAMSFAYAQDVPKPEQAPTRPPFKAFRMKPILDPQLSEDGASLVVTDEQPTPAIKKRLELKNTEPEAKVEKNPVLQKPVPVAILVPVPPSKPKIDPRETVPAAAVQEDVALLPATSEEDETALSNLSSIRKPIEALIERFETKEEAKEEIEDVVPFVEEPAVDVAVLNGIPIPTPKPIMSKTADSTFIERIFATPVAPTKEGSAVRIMGGGSRTAGGAIGGIERTARGSFLDNDLRRMNVGSLKEVRGRPSVLLPGLTRVVAAPDAPKADRRGVPSEVIVFFEEGGTKLEPGQMDILQSDVINVMNRDRKLKLEIVGYSENIGEQTKKLSEERAVMILKYLQKKRIDAKRLTVKGKANKTGVEPRDRVEMYFSR